MSWSFFERGDYEQSDPSKWNKSFAGLINIFLVSTNYEQKMRILIMPYHTDQDCLEKLKTYFLSGYKCLSVMFDIQIRVGKNGTRFIGSVGEGYPK